MRNRHPAPERKCQIIQVFAHGLHAAPDREGFRDPRGDGKSTEAGFYLALWPAHAATRRHGKGIRYLGPFDTCTVPILLKLTADSFSLVESVKVDPGIGAGNPQGAVVRLPDRGAHLRAAARPAGSPPGA